MTKIRILRKVNSGSDPTLDSGQPYIDATVTPGRLYIGQGNGSLTNSEISVSKADDADYATNASYATNAGVATQLSTERSIITNLGSNTAAVFDGTKDIEAGVNGILGVSNGGTGRDDGTVSEADTAGRLSTSTRLITDLASETYVSFIGAGDTGYIGVTGVLPTSHGGTGSSSITFNYGSSKTTSSTQYCRKWDASSSGSISYPFITEHGDIFYVGATCDYYSIGNLWVGAIVYGDQTEDLATQYQGLSQNWTLKINLKGWLGDIISNVSIKSVSVIARGTDTTVLNGYQCGGGYCTYIDDTDKVIYIGQSFNTSPTGIYITVMGTISG